MTLIQQVQILPSKPWPNPNCSLGTAHNPFLPKHFSWPLIHTNLHSLQKWNISTHNYQEDSLSLVAFSRASRDTFDLNTKGNLPASWCHQFWSKDLTPSWHCYWWSWLGIIFASLQWWHLLACQWWHFLILERRVNIVISPSGSSWPFFSYAKPWKLFENFYLPVNFWLSGKESACQCRRFEFSPWVGKIP